MEELKKIPSRVNLELFDTSIFTPEKIRDIFRGGKLPTAEAMVDEIVLRSLKVDATDIHIEPRETELSVRFGCDGILKRLVALPKEISDNIANVLKSKAGLNQFEKKKPQEGRYSVSAAGFLFDIRVSTLPTIFGERFALRILRKTESVSKLGELGFTGENFEKLLRLLHKPSGLILSAGPTGSGKSKIMQACISEIQSPEKNIITLEDPVEYKMEFASQVQTSGDKGFTPSDLFRLVLRQSPNVIMLNEIRDLETSMIAAEAVLAGVLVFSSILAGDAVGTIARMQNFGLSPYWVATTLGGVVHQKLIRKICNECMEEYIPTNEELKILGTGHFNLFYKGKGCENCNGTGYRERTGIHEILIIDDRLRDLIYRGASFIELKEAAYASGFEDIRTDAIKKANAGITTPMEILRALG